MTLLHIISILILPQFLLSLTCYRGTANSLVNTSNNCTTSDECITFLFNTSLDGSTSPTSVYTCGNYTLYQQLPYVSNLSYCLTDNCQMRDLPQSPPRCASFLTETNCTAQSNCFWCGNSSFGVDLCQPLPGGPIDVCWAVPVVIPALMCGYIGCEPSTEPNYEPGFLTLDYLTNFGLPPTTFQGDTFARGIAQDARSRYNNTRVLNDTYAFCKVDQDLQHWCGFTTNTPFTYCIVAESWPQSNVWGWVQNTTFTGTSLTTIFPAFCACPIAGRAYYLPSGSVDTFSHHSIVCPVENTLLAFYILLMFISLAVSILVIVDITILVIGTWQKKVGARASFEKQSTFIMALLKSKTIWTKLLIMIYLPLTIGNEAMFMGITGSTSTLETAAAVIRLLSVIMVLFAFSQAVFTVVEILLKAKVFGTRTDAIILRIFKWVFFVTNGSFLFGAFGMLIAFAYYLKKVLDFSVNNVGELALYGQKVSILGKAIMLVLLLTQAIMLIETGIMLAIVTWRLSKLEKHIRGMKDVFGRVAGLWIAWVMGIPNLGILAWLTPIVAWVQVGSIPSYWSSVYETELGYLWSLWADYATELIWICAIAYAMRTRARKGWLLDQFANFTGKRTMIEQKTNSSRSASGAISGVASEMTSGMASQVTMKSITVQSDDDSSSDSD